MTERYRQSPSASAMPSADPIMSRERAEQFAARVMLHVEVGRFDYARQVIDAAEREIAAERRERAGRRGRSPDKIPVAALEPFCVGLREINSLDELGIATLGQLLAYRRADIESVPGIGPAMVDHICESARQLVAECFFGRLPPRYRLFEP